MTVKQVLVYPDSSLRETCEPVEDFEGDDLKELLEDLRDTLSAYNAEGLAAPQIGVNKRVFVTRNGDDIRVFINPKLVDTDGEIKSNEGCLSFPSVYEVVNRYEDLTITAQDEQGEEFTLSLDEFDAVAVQHEYDHLDGVLFIDRVSNLKKRYMLKKLNKYKKKLITNISVPLGR